MRLYTSESLWAIAKLWYTFFGVIALAMLVTAWQDGFDNFFDMLRRTHPTGWLVIAAAIAPGPLAHWLSKRVKP